MAGVDMCAREDLFRYASGRWLIYEEYQLKQRYVECSVANLCS
jgi:hypothetical protein